jgi:hypothetical protein
MTGEIVSLNIPPRMQELPDPIKQSCDLVWRLPSALSRASSAALRHTTGWSMPPRICAQGSTPAISRPPGGGVAAPRTTQISD